MTGKAVFAEIKRTREIALTTVLTVLERLKVSDIQDVIMSAIGGENVTTTVEGLERYPVNVRY